MHSKTFNCLGAWVYKNYLRLLVNWVHSKTFICQYVWIYKIYIHLLANWVHSKTFICQCVWVCKIYLHLLADWMHSKTFIWMIFMTRSQLLEGPKGESQTKYNGKERSRGTLPGSQHLKGVEGRAGAPRWD
jgi:hypothetical protein